MNIIYNIYNMYNNYTRIPDQEHKNEYEYDLKKDACTQTESYVYTSFECNSVKEEPTTNVEYENDYFFKHLSLTTSLSIEQLFTHLPFSLRLLPSGHCFFFFCILIYINIIFH